MFETNVRARSYELDAFGHVNHAVFLNYLEGARFDALEVAGFDPATLEERGWGVHVVRVEVDYKREVRLGDRLRIQTRPEQLRNTSMILRQRILLEGQPGETVVEARVVLVWVGEDGRPMRIPDEVRTAFHPPRPTP